LQVNIFNQAACCLSSNVRKDIIALVEKTLVDEKTELKNLNIILTNDNYLKELNRKFLKKDKPTNVISFRMEEVSEIYISYDRISNIDELYYYIIHGLLHIVGYDHKTKAETKTMESKCLQYLKLVKTAQSSV
jgi:probable rRNA maturation factor